MEKMPLWDTNSFQAGEITPIRRTAVRETGLSRHNGGPIEGIYDSVVMVGWVLGVSSHVNAERR